MEVEDLRVHEREQKELRARLRARVVEEIIQTERTYVADLRILASQICVPLRERISPQDHAKIFSNLEMLLGLHEQLSAALDTQADLPVEEHTIGAIFLKYADFMKTYSTYCTNMDTATETVRKLVKVPAFAEVLSMAGKSGALRMLSLADFLIKPVQRITKYPLLLKELRSNTVSGHADLPDLEAAKFKLESLLDKINAEKKANEAIQQNLTTLKSIQQQIDDLNITLTERPRKFVKKGSITRVLENEKQDFTYFLFDDLFLVCKNKGQTRYQLRHTYLFDQCLIRTTKKPNLANIEAKHKQSRGVAILHALDPYHILFGHRELLTHIPFFPLYLQEMRDCFELLNLDKQKVHTYAVPTDDKIAVCDLIKYMQEAIYAQTLHIEHILKVKYGWFLDAQIDYVADLVFCYRLFCSPMEFLNIFETRYPTVEEGKETLWHFIEGLEPADFEAEGQKNLKNKLDNMIALVQTQAMQSKMTRDMKKLTRTLHASPTISDGASSPVSSSPTAYRIGLSRSGSLRTISPSPSRRRMSSCAPSPPPLFLDNDALPTHPEISPAALSHFSTKDAWVGVSAQAQGITQRECDVFRRVRTQEVLVGEGPNIDEMLDLMSWTTRWVSTKILSYDSSETRADAISGFISLAAEFRKMNNFNGIMEITQSLRSAPIERLKESWQILPPNIVTEWASITELMSSSHSYHNYRQALKAIDFNSPCLPCILVIISDISAIDLPDWSEGKINMEYVRHVSALLREFRTYQKNCHSISTGVPELYSDLVLKEEDLEKLSLATCTENSTLPRNRANSISVKSIRKKKPNLQTSIFSRPVAAEFGPADWDRIMAVSETKTFQAGDTIANYNADEDSHKPQEFYYIKEGSVKATRTKGKWWYDVQAGDGIGLLTLLNLKFNKQIVATASPTVLKMANLSYVTQLLESDLDLATRFYKYVAKQVNSSLRFAMGQLTSQKPNGNRRSISAAFSYTSLSPSTPTSSPAPFSYLSGSPSTTPTSSPAPFSYTNPTPAPFSYTSATPAPFSYTNPAPSSLSSSSSSPSARTPSSPSSARTPSSPSSARAPSSPSTSRAPSPSPSSSSLSSSSLSSSSLSSSTSDLHVPTRKGSFTSLPTVSSNGPTAPGSPSAKIRTDVLNGNTPISSSSRSQSFSSNEPPLSELFTLEEDEVVIKSYECKFKRVNGRLYVTKYNLFFYGKSFGVQTKKQVPFATVAYVKATKQLEVKQEMKILKFYFKTQEEVNETEALIGSVFSKASQSNFDPNNIKSGPKSELDTVISPADWQLILTGTTTASYPAGSVIISEGVRHTRLCQILSGRCVITKKVSKNFVETTEKIASRHAGELFGEMSFLEPGSLASASVVADTDVEICILDFQYITVLLSVYRHLGPSLYKYLALLMHSRLAELEAK